MHVEVGPSPARPQCHVHVLLAPAKEGRPPDRPSFLCRDFRTRTAGRATAGPPGGSPSMTPRRSLHAPALFVVVLLALAPAADAAKPFRVPGCLAGDLAPAASEGVLVRLCEDPESNSTGVGLGTLLPSGQITRRTVPENAEGPFAAGPAGEVWGVAGAGQGGLELDRIA